MYYPIRLCYHKIEVMKILRAWLRFLPSIMPTKSKSTQRAARARKDATPATPMPAAKLQPHAELARFTTEFFTLLGASVRPLERRKKQSPLLVELSAPLADYFGAPQLTLAFQQVESASGQQLVAHGSPIFDKMIAYLERHSAVTQQRLPVRFTGSDELLQAVRPLNAGTTNLRMQETFQSLLLFTWRITYRADDKREELYTVLLNEQGERILQPSEGSTSEPALVIEQLLADAQPVPLEPNEDGQPTPPRLPPMTQLAALAESARKYAIYHADVRCVSHEAEILPRLYKTLNRLTTYYQQQIEEIYEAHDPLGEKRLALESDLARKLAEEVENHRLRVQVDLVSYALLQLPVVSADITLSDGQRTATITVSRNRYSGVLHRPRCHACGQPAARIALDRNGHITCEACLQQCGSCQDLLCATCGVAPCPVCQRENCDTCGQLCWACGERACAEHISTCPVCGDAVCHACQVACACCGVRQCRSHLRVDHVLAQQGESVLICATCAVRCPGCAQYSAEVGICATSGQRFCQRCLTACQQCGKVVGPGFYTTIDGAAYCRDCLLECPTCGHFALTTTPCPTCGVGYCASCGQRCSVCGQSYCREHSHHFAGCNHAVCSGHRAHCSVCATDLCPQCNPLCAICERHHCPTHVTTCSRCSQSYCSSCVTGKRLCATCASVEEAGVPVDLALEPCADHSRVRLLAGSFAWKRVRNHRYTIYWGENELDQTALVVTTMREEGERVIAIRGKGVAQARPAKAAPAATEPEKDANAWMQEFQDWLQRMRRQGRGRR